jgi:hypothetical protein
MRCPGPGFFCRSLLLLIAVFLSTGGFSARAQTHLLDNGIDPANLGKGDWIWEMPECETSLGLADGDVQGVIDFEKNAGMQWITVKCGDGTNIWTQFDPDLITRAHNAGLKIFGWAYVYGSTNVPTEITVALHALNLGADGFIIDAESEYEATGQRTNATRYCQGIRTNFPTRFMAHAPFPVISVHANFPYVEFGTYCDAVMPQDYWVDIGGSTNYAPQMVVQMNTEWRNWQHSLAGTATNAIKPIAPIGQGYNSDLRNLPCDSTQIAAFFNALRTNIPMATPAGYNGISFWSCQHHSAAPDKWPGISAISFNGAPGAAAFLDTVAVPNRVADAGATVTFVPPAGGTPPLFYRWKCNGSDIAGATNLALRLDNVQTNANGLYSSPVSNMLGSANGSVATLSVFPQQTVVFEDDFESNSAANWTVNKSTTDVRFAFHYDYSADGIPSAPHSAGGTTHGLKLQANLTTGLVSALSLSPIGQSFGGDFRLHFDMWINVNGPFPAGGASSTEFLTAGIGTAGTDVEWAGTGSRADGYWFSVDGDGGVSDTSTTFGDFSAYIGTALQAPTAGIYAAGTRGSSSGYYVAGIPSGATAPAFQQAKYAQQNGALSAGAIGLAWHDVIISRQGSVVQWAIDGVELAAISNATLTAGNIFIGFWDPFALPLTDNTNLNFGLVDNVRVEVPVTAPMISQQPQPLFVKAGGVAEFAVTASGAPTPSYQWFADGTPIDGATNAIYLRTNIQAGDVANYSVVVSNSVKGITSSNALLSIIPTVPAEFGTPTLAANGGLEFTASGQTMGTYVIETSTNLMDWTAVALVVATNGNICFSGGSVTNDVRRFFRARPGP